MVAAALAARPPVFELVPVAHACSCPDCDVVRDSDVIISGRVVGWRVSERQPFPERQDAVPLDVEIAVDRVFKGWAPATLVLLDPGSLSMYENNGRKLWMGGSGGCQAFSEDPAGAYVVLGYDVDGQNSLQLWGPPILFRGAAPEGERYEQLLGILHERLGSPYPPGVGDSPPATEPRGTSNDWMFLSAIGGALLLITLVLLLCGPKREPRDGSAQTSGRGPNLD